MLTAAIADKERKAPPKPKELPPPFPRRLAIDDQERKGVPKTATVDELALDALDVLLARYASKRDVLKGLRAIADPPRWFHRARQVRIIGEILRLQVEEADSLDDAAEVFAAFTSDMERAAAALGVDTKRLRETLLRDDVQARFKNSGPGAATLLAASKLIGGSPRNLHRYLTRLEDYEFTHGIRVGLPPPPPPTAR